MTIFTLHTYDWVPEMPRGYVRDLRVRWALEEAGLPYDVATTPFREKTAEHLAIQPFGQVPWLTDGEATVFESGAILLYLGDRSEALLPSDPQRRSEAVQWVFAALNSVEMAVLPWSLMKFAGDESDTPGRKHLDRFLAARLEHLEAVLTGRDWLAGAFSVADILMVDVLRLAHRLGALESYPACSAYVARGEVRPAFVKAHADQLAHFAAAD